jgi:hypothetical protein
MDLESQFQNKHQPRNGSCFTVRKAYKFHKNLVFIHPPDSKQIIDIPHKELVTIFNTYQYFYCYDPYTYLAFMAAACGCIPIVIPIEGVNKVSWLKSLFCANYMEEKNLTNMDGIAYGVDDIEYARGTLDNARNQQDDIINYGLDTVKNFVRDMETIKDASSVYWSVEHMYTKN